MTLKADAPRTIAPLSVARVMQILATLSAASGPVGLAGLSREMNVPKSSLVALLRGLVDTGYVAVSAGAYRLGPAAFELGAGIVKARQRLPILDTVRAGMRELNSRSGETVLFAVLSEDGEWAMTYVDIVETLKTIRVSVTIGDRRPLWCTAGGRILLAARSEAEVDAYLDRVPIEGLTPSTQTERGRLLEAVRRARAEDVARVSDELVSGVTGIASPIRDDTGAVLGVLIVAAPTVRLSDGGAELASLVSQSARAISYELGCRRAAA